MRARLRFFYRRILEVLWVKPLLVGLLSVAAAVLAKRADSLDLAEVMPSISSESIETLLQISASSMLVIATFAVGSMISAYSSAASGATPRTFPLLIADDISQNALSVYIGAFIFSIITLVAVQNAFYGKAGYVAVFLMTVLVFAIVIVTFVRWVDRIARLGRLGHTIEKVEAATRDALRERKQMPNLGGVPVEGEPRVWPVCHTKIGYVQLADVSALNAVADRFGVTISVVSLPGAFATPDRPLALVEVEGEMEDADIEKIVAAFTVGDSRTFDGDPRFGLIVLSEIASKALSPGINDPGTAIDVVGTFVRLFAFHATPADDEPPGDVAYPNVQVPDLEVADMFDDAFRALTRDGAGTVEVGIRLMKAFNTLKQYEVYTDVAESYTQSALARAKLALTYEGDYEALKACR